MAVSSVKIENQSAFSKTRHDIQNTMNTTELSQDNQTNEQEYANNSQYKALFDSTEREI